MELKGCCLCGAIADEELVQLAVDVPWAESDSNAILRVLADELPSPAQVGATDARYFQSMH